MRASLILETMNIAPTYVLFSFIFEFLGSKEREREKGQVIVRLFISNWLELLLSSLIVNIYLSIDSIKTE